MAELIIRIICGEFKQKIDFRKETINICEMEKLRGGSSNKNHEIYYFQVGKNKSVI